MKQKETILEAGGKPKQNVRGATVHLLHVVPLQSGAENLI